MTSTTDQSSTSPGVAGRPDGPPSFPRLPAGMRVLLQVDHDGGLATAEPTRFAKEIAEIGQDEWTAEEPRTDRGRSS